MGDVIVIHGERVSNGDTERSDNQFVTGLSHDMLSSTFHPH